MLRVISGTARNLKLITPEGKDTRPTTDRIKETLFNILQFDIAGSVIIDFFSGSGSLGIEALSRGAKHCYFVDNDKEANKCIVSNISHTHFENISTVFMQDAGSVIPLIHEKHVDIIFMDPPYDKGLEAEILKKLGNASYVDSDTLIVIEARIDTDFSYLNDYGYDLTREKEYKTNKHIFCRKKEIQ